MARYPLARFWYPELMFFETPEQASTAMQAAMRPLLVKSLLLSVVWMSPWLFFFARNDLVRELIIASGLHRLGATVGIAVFMSGISLWSLCSLVLDHFLFRRRLHDSLRRKLIDQGIRVCLDCGYDLRGLTEPRCPECGARFEEERQR